MPLIDATPLHIPRNVDRLESAEQTLQVIFDLELPLLVAHTLLWRDNERLLLAFEGALAQPERRADLEAELQAWHAATAVDRRRALTILRQPNPLPIGDADLDATDSSMRIRQTGWLERHDAEPAPSLPNPVTELDVEQLRDQAIDGMACVFLSIVTSVRPHKYPEASSRLILPLAVAHEATALAFGTADYDAPQIAEA